MNSPKDIVNIIGTENPKDMLKAIINEITLNFHNNEEQYLEDYEKGRKYYIEIKVIPATIVKRKKHNIVK